MLVVVVLFAEILPVIVVVVFVIVVAVHIAAMIVVVLQILLALVAEGPLDRRVALGLRIAGEAACEASDLDRLLFVGVERPLGGCRRAPVRLGGAGAGGRGVVGIVVIAIEDRRRRWRCGLAVAGLGGRLRRRLAEHRHQVAFDALDRAVEGADARVDLVLGKRRVVGPELADDAARAWA